ncbi:MAG: BamA/TamA family outer membrane protein [Microcystaceae cyanobacterium]
MIIFAKLSTFIVFLGLLLTYVQPIFGQSLNSPESLQNHDLKSEVEEDLIETETQENEEEEESETETQSGETSPLNPNESQLRVPLFNAADGITPTFSFGFGSLIPDNTALRGATRRNITLPRITYQETFPIGFFLQRRLGDNQRLLLETVGDSEFLGTDLSYSVVPKDWNGALSVNLNTRRGITTAFKGGEREVKLPNDGEPWLIRTGGGIEYTELITPRLNLAVAANYERISSRSGMFSNRVIPKDELGNQLTVSSIGQDDLVSLSLSGLYENVDRPRYPSEGLRVRFGSEQAIPIGQGSIVYNRLAGNVSGFIPLNGLASGDKTDILVLNLQGGTFLGDVPPYGGYNLGGSNSVRGYNRSEITSGRTFVQTTIEYRSPAFISFDLLQNEINIRGIAFFDYGTDLGSKYTVIGQPAVVRNKPGWGLGYGAGVHFVTPVGLFRLESGWNDQGGNATYFLVGDRF